MSNVYINRILESERFDTVIVEEAGMAILPTLFYCASLARQRTIMVGDPATATHRTVQAGLRASRDADHRRSCPLPGKPCHRDRHGRFGNLCHPGGRFFPLQREHGRRIRRLLPSDQNLSGKIECRAVHRFQGGERDMVIFDTVDVDPLPPGILLAGNTPGASSANLINVSLSRARGKLVVIADVGYFRRHPQARLSHVLQEAIRIGRCERVS
jgi:hypothetical protein